MFNLTNNTFGSGNGEYYIDHDRAGHDSKVMELTCLYILFNLAIKNHLSLIEFNIP